MKKEIIYHLCDDLGVNRIALEVLIPLGTIFEHQYGTYEVDEIIESKYDINVYCYPRSNYSRLKN
jgi:hypothetical protein